MSPRSAQPTNFSPTWPPQRSLWASIPLTLLLFLGSGIGGVQLSSVVAPESIIASFLGLLTLPAAFILGMYCWLGFAVVAAITHLIRRLIRWGLQHDAASLQSRTRDVVPPGSFAFVPVSVLLSGISGFIMALLSTNLGFILTLDLYLGVGLAYGLGCWLLARAGFLPFPEEA